MPEEVDFNYLISRLEREIKEAEKDLEKPPKEVSSLERTLARYFILDRRELLSLIKTAIRTERDRIKAARDYIDSILFARMDESRIHFSDDFKDSILNKSKESRGEDSSHQ